VNMYMDLCPGSYGGPYMSLCVGLLGGPRGTDHYERGNLLLEPRFHESHRHLTLFDAVPARRLVIRGGITRDLDPPLPTTFR
jgi:hypothetical protein